MRILSIETSCDETAISLLEITGEFPDIQVQVIDSKLASQVAAHQEYGGVYPSLAKRLHARNFPVLLEQIVKNNEETAHPDINASQKKQIQEWLTRHDGLADKIFTLVKKHGITRVDAVAVTVGPGLEPALWVGINIARSLALITDVPIVPTNHMEGHLLSTLVPDDITDGGTHHLKEVAFPAIALLVSGGHTELTLMDKWRSYEKIGQTRDDAAGEAFDKIGRLLGLPYPAGPEIAKLAQSAQKSGKLSLPRPMIDTDNFDFSFSGLKTAAARTIEKNQPLSEEDRSAFAHELQQAIIEVLTKKTEIAARKTEAESILVGGGVSANQLLRSQLKSVAKDLQTDFHIAPPTLTTDNATMIGLAGYVNRDKRVQPRSDIEASSRLSL